MLKYIEIALPDGEAEENGGLMAAKRRRTKRQEEAEKAENRIKYIRIGVVLGILAAVLVLIFVLTRMGNGGEETQEAKTEAAGQTVSSDSGEQTETLPEGGASDSSVEPDNNQYITDFSQYELQKDAVPQVNQLISDYFQAKVDQDAARLYTLFGKAEDDRLSERQEELENEAVWVEDYQDITCYTKPGLTEDSYVVYVTYEVKFRRVDTPAPGLMWCYVVKQDDGTYIIRENVVGDEADYVAAQNQTEDVLLLSKQVNERLRQAIESDSLLAGRYSELRNGAVVTESTAEGGQDSDIQLLDENGEVVSGGAGSAEDTAAETEAGVGADASGAATSAGDTSQDASQAGDAAAAESTAAAESPAAGAEETTLAPGSAGSGDSVIELE